MQELHGTLKRYPWGTFDEIPAILGIPADGEPYAEYWLGAHELSPSTINGRPLPEILAEDPAQLGEAHDTFGRLPFLMKILSARHALSLQAHPSRAEAEVGFEEENKVGVPLDHPKRIFRDTWGKPEIIIALTEMHMLTGFRDPHETSALFDALGLTDVLEPVMGPLIHRTGSAGMAEVFLDVLSLDGERLEVINHVLAAGIAHANESSPVGDFARTIVELDEIFPGDRGILAALLLNRIVLQPGEASFTPAGRLHAHLSGTGIEVMAASDNTLRGGLTTKHIAVDGLVSVLEFTASTPEIMTGHVEENGVWGYDPHCPEFRAWRIELEAGQTAELPAHGQARVALVTKGHMRATGTEAPLDLASGQAMFVPANGSPVQLSGQGQVFVASPGVM